MSLKQQLTDDMKAAMTGGVTIGRMDVTLAPGDSTDVTKTVHTPEILPTPDIYFLADTTRAKSVVQLPESLVAQPQRVIIRARYIKNNQPIGEYSQNTTVVTNPVKAPPLTNV